MDNKDTKNTKKPMPNPFTGNVEIIPTYSKPSILRRFFRKVRFRRSNLHTQLDGGRLGRVKSLKPKIKIKIPSFMRSKKFILLSVLFTVTILVSVLLFCEIILEIRVFKNISKFFRELDFDIYMAIIFGLILQILIGNICLFILKIKKLKKRIVLLLLLNAILLSIIFSIFFGTYIFKHPKIQTHYPLNEEHLLDYERPIEVKFNVPVNISKLKPSIVQDIPGTWKWEPYLGIKSLTRSGKFYPDETVIPNQRFVLYIAGINKFTDKKEHEYGFIFKAPDLPKVESTFPTNESTEVLSSDPIIIKFNKSYRDLVDLEFKFDPLIEFDLNEEEIGQVKLIPKSKLQQGKSYSLRVNYRSKIVNIKTRETLHLENPELLLDLKFSVVKEPLIESFKPSGISVLPKSEVIIKFSEPIDPEILNGGISISPEVMGNWELQDEQTLIFNKAADFTKATKYTIKIKEGTKSKKGGVFEKEILHEFETIGKVKVIGFYPANVQNYVYEWDSIMVAFDQEVDKISVMERFVVTPSVSGTYRWEGNTLIYDLTRPLEYEKDYEIRVKSGVKSINGMDSDKDYTSYFKTRSNFVLFYVPFYYQTASFACNIFTAKMVLASRGHYVDYTTLISEIGYDDNRANGNWTGNPYAEYVGTWDANWGYGVYYPPIQNILSSRGISSVPHTNWSISGLAKAVEQRRPVIIWRYNGVGGGQNISWTSDDGTYVHAFNGMHGSVVTGFEGTSDNPSSFYINDPWLGQFWIDAGTLDYYWSFSGRMALEVL